MQLAVSDAVYLLDMIALPQCLSNSALRAFVHDVFGNSSTIKLGITMTYSGRALCLEYRVSWVRVPPEAAHFS